jgi:tRNA pseudouridine32 synthase/23S rRNA pseudouridine746 synthase
MLVIDKPAGVAVHPGPGGGPNLSASLDGLRFGLPRRPEIAHRLDRDTSGCLVLGRHRQALIRLGKLFAGGRVEKLYWAVVEGEPAADAGEIDLPLGPRSPDPANWLVEVNAAGQPALTRWRVLGRAGGRAWLALEPVTGRTHQLRAHCAASGWPILGDAAYGGARGSGARLHLHARRVVVPLYPKKAPVAVEAEAPAHMRVALGACGFTAAAPGSDAVGRTS